MLIVSVRTRRCPRHGGILWVNAQNAEWHRASSAFAGVRGTEMVLMRSLHVEPQQETRNFYHDPEYQETVTQLHAELVRLRAEAQDTGEAPRSAYGNRPFDGERAPRRP